MIIKRATRDSDFRVIGNVAYGDVFEWQGVLLIKTDIPNQAIRLDTGATFTLSAGAILKLIKGSFVEEL